MKKAWRSGLEREISSKTKEDGKIIPELNVERIEPVHSDEDLIREFENFAMELLNIDFELNHKQIMLDQGI